MKKVEELPACPLTRNESFGNVSPFSAQDLINIENLKNRRRHISVSRGKTGRGVLSGPLYAVLRLPVLVFVGCFVALELCTYALVRFVIWAFECSTAVVDRKSAKILKEMESTTRLGDYMKLATELDRLQKKPTGYVCLFVSLLSISLLFTYTHTHTHTQIDTSSSSRALQTTCQGKTGDWKVNREEEKE
jgi:hypothetical protein